MKRFSTALPRYPVNRTKKASRLRCLTFAPYAWRRFTPYGVMRCGRGLRTTHYIVQPRLTIFNGARNRHRRWSERGRNRLSDKGCHPFCEFPDDSAKICSFSVSAKNMLTEYTFYLFRILCFRLELRSHLVGK